MRLSFEKQKKIGGFLFTLPFVIGFFLFFLYPLVQAVIFSFNELVLTSTTFELQPRGWENYRYALQVHPEFTRTFVEVIGQLLTRLPLIIAFSFFAATLLNQEFRGRALVRALFFLPVIMSAGIVMRLEMSDYSVIMLQASRSGAGFGGAVLRNLFAESAYMPSWLLDYVIGAAESLPIVIRSSGVQILIFLAGLQSIPREIYEAVSVEGATPWERFWLVTFPMLTPLLLTNVVYTIVDSLTAMNNELVIMIRDTMLRGAGYGAAMAMAMIYFVTIAIILLVVYRLISRRIFYYVE
ncbi:MAG TPA: sugar ABC transporter permease [Limnochordia bacterium]|nr:sugar ABC transporter permease [Limnochordia bacterium]